MRDLLGYTFGLGGFALMAWGLFFDIRAGTFGAASKVANLSAMHQSTLIVIIGGFLFLAGCVVLSVKVASEEHKNISPDAGGVPKIVGQVKIKGTMLYAMSDGNYRVEGSETIYPTEGSARRAIDDR